MRRPTTLIALALLAALSVAACGEKQDLESKEGEPISVDGLLYNVRLTRFLNRGDTEDSSYLVGKPPPPAGKAYFGVFINVKNEGDVPAPVPEGVQIRDTRDNVYGAIQTPSRYALALGRPIAPGAIVPELDSPAAEGPVNGAMVLFLVDEAVSDNRPLELLIPAAGHRTGTVELDI